MIRTTKFVVRNFSTIVSASIVKTLRDISGAPMIDCKKALLDVNVQGDIKKAVDWLRAKGIARASATDNSRTANEGLMGVCVGQNGVLTMVEVNSETDFVCMNKNFQAFVATVCQTINQKFQQIGEVPISEVLHIPILKPNLKNQENLKSFADNSTIEESLGDIISSIREKIVIQRAMNFIPSHNSMPGLKLFSSYVHGKVGTEILPDEIQLGKAASIVGLNVQSDNLQDKNLPTVMEEVGKKLAMHVVAARPLYLSPDVVPKDVLERESSIFREQMKDKKKKPEMIEKIIQGKVAKRLAEICLLSQTHLVEADNPVVKTFLDQKGKAHSCTISLNEYKLWTLKKDI